MGAVYGKLSPNNNSIEKLFIADPTGKENEQATTENIEKLDEIKKYFNLFGIVNVSINREKLLEYINKQIERVYMKDEDVSKSLEDNMSSSVMILAMMSAYGIIILIDNGTKNINIVLPKILMTENRGKLINYLLSKSLDNNAKKFYEMSIDFFNNINNEIKLINIVNIAIKFSIIMSSYKIIGKKIKSEDKDNFHKKLMLSVIDDIPSNVCIFQSSFINSDISCPKQVSEEDVSSMRMEITKLNKDLFDAANSRSDINSIKSELETNINLLSLKTRELETTKKELDDVKNNSGPSVIFYIIILVLILVASYYGYKYHKTDCTQNLQPI